MLLTNGYDLAEKREQIDNIIENLKAAINNCNSSTNCTILLSDNDAMDILLALSMAKNCINYRLKKLVEKEEDWN